MKKDVSPLSIAIILGVILSILTRCIISFVYDKTLAEIQEYTSVVNINLPVLPDTQTLSDDQLIFLTAGYDELIDYRNDFRTTIEALSFLLSESNNDGDYYIALLDLFLYHYDDDLSNWYRWPDDYSTFTITKEMEQHCSFISSIYKDVESLSDNLIYLLEEILSQLPLEKSIDSIRYISGDIATAYHGCVDLYHSIEEKLEYIKPMYPHT